MNYNEQFKILLQQAGVEENEALSDGELRKVIIDDKERLWKFKLHFNQLIDQPLFDNLSQKVKHAFQSIAEVSIEISADRFEARDVYEYLNDALNMTNASENFKRQINRSKVFYNEGILKFSFTSEVTKECFERQLQTNLIKAYEALGIKITSIETDVDVEAVSKNDEQLEQKINDDTVKLINEHKKQKEAEEKEPEKVVKQLGKKLSFDGVRPMSNIEDEEFNVRLEGTIFSKDIIHTRTGKQILNMKITDYTDSIQIKRFGNKEEETRVFEALNEGDWVIVEGNVEYDEFAKDLVMNLRALTEIKPPK
ncbi:MAG TPA: PolC-type DNA polymerase III, partial [Candidatus Nosocomiicoccus stercorigallinarum]|nr:PolC-type DNA polymerase III [Candidatus Nosocomiicoccus stercorigallinarum]